LNKVEAPSGRLAPLSVAGPGYPEG
jgi:hypothetical protein